MVTECIKSLKKKKKTITVYYYYLPILIQRFVNLILILFRIYR